MEDTDWSSVEGLSILLKHKDSPDDVLNFLKKLNQNLGSIQFLTPDSEVIFYRWFDTIRK